MIHAVSPLRRSVFRIESAKARPHDQRVTHTHVEDVPHLGAIDVAFALQELEDRRHFPGTQIDLRIKIVGERARQVARQAAAGDVGHACDDLLDGVFLEQLDDGLDVDARRLQQNLTERRVSPLAALALERKSESSGYALSNLSFASFTMRRTSE